MTPGVGLEVVERKRLGSRFLFWVGPHAQQDEYPVSLRGSGSATARGYPSPELQLGGWRSLSRKKRGITWIIDIDGAEMERRWVASEQAE